MKPKNTPPGRVKKSAGKSADQTAQGPKSPSLSVKKGATGAPKKPLFSMKKKAHLLENQLKEAKKDYLYLKADFENYKKNVFKERQDLIRYGLQNFIESLADEVLDDFDRAFQTSAGDRSSDSFKTGVGFIHAKLKRVLKTGGVSSIDPVGQPFDPKYHEALSRQADRKIPEDHIIAVVKKAYLLHDRLVRPAQVIVSTGPAEKEKAESDPSDLPEA